MRETTSHLVYMANQIARNFAAQGEQAAIAATAEHIRLFWDPRMKAAIKHAPRDAMSIVAASAIAVLRDAQDG